MSNLSKNVLFNLSNNYYYIIDTSFIIFCAASSAFKNYVYQEDILKSSFSPNFNPTLDPEFNYIFEKTFISKIENTIKQITPLSFNRKNIIFSLDCPRKDIWRRQFFPEYKINRDTSNHSKDKFNIGDVFKYAHNILIPKYCDENDSKIISCTCAESDDIIAVLTKYLLNKDKNNNVIILSSDRDMVQLCNDRTIIVSSMNEVRDPKKEFMNLTKIKKLSNEITNVDFLLFKIILGDKSDNIPSIKYRLGPKKAMEYVLDKSRSKLKLLLKEDAEIANGFKRNKLLISMNEIPKYISDLIIENFKSLC